MLAQVIEYAERGDAFVPPRVPEPSERADAQTLLAMIMMQYPDHIASKDSVLYMLKSAEKGESGLAVVLIARAHMFGDYAPKDMNAFGAYMNNNSGKRYPVKFGTDSVFYALEKTPAGWKGRNEMLEQLKFSQEMNESFNRQKEAATVKGSDLSAQAFKLMEEGEKIDALTLEALGAGPKIAEIRAKGEMLNRESTGANDRIKVKVITSEEYSNAVKEMISIKPKLDSESKVKLERANQIRLDNVAQLRNLQIQVATQFYAGNIAEVIESGSMINRYYGNSCRLLYRQFELSKMTGAVVPDKSKIESAKEL
jgi:hypothetical protein